MDTATAIQKRMDAPTIDLGEPTDEMSHDEFVQKRDEHGLSLGGSEWRDSANIAPWGCARKLYYKKAGVERDYPRRETAAMRSGLRLEGMAREVYAERRGMSCVAHSRALDPPEGFPSWWRGNIDAVFALRVAGLTPDVMERNRQEAIFRSDAPGLHLWENKTRAGFAFRNAIKDSSDAVTMQVVHYEVLLGVPLGVRNVYQPHPEDMAWQEIEFDSALIDAMLELGARFIDAVEAGKPPKRRAPGYRACQHCEWRETCWEGPPPQTADDTAAGLVKLDSAELADLATKFLALGDEIKELKGERDAVRDMIEAEMTIAEVQHAAVGGRRIHAAYSSSVRQRQLIKAILGKDPEWVLQHLKTIDLKAARDDYPALVEEYTGRSKKPRVAVY